MGNFLTKCNNNLNSFHELFIYVEHFIYKTVTFGYAGINTKQTALGHKG